MKYGNENEKGKSKSIMKIEKSKRNAKWKRMVILKMKLNNEKCKYKRTWKRKMNMKTKMKNGYEKIANGNGTKMEHGNNKWKRTCTMKKEMELTNGSEHGNGKWKWTWNMYDERENEHRKGNDN